MVLSQGFYDGINYGNGYFGSARRADSG